MAAACTTRLPHPRPGRHAAIWSMTTYLSGKALLISQLTSISRGRSTIWCLWAWVVAVTTLLQQIDLFSGGVHSPQPM